MSKKKKHHNNHNYNGQKRVTGKDLQFQTTTIELKGRKYEMNFDLNAMAELEDIFGTLQIAIAELKKKKLKAVRSFLYAVLKSTDETLTEFEVGKLIDMNNFTSIEKAITKLINNAFEEDEEDDKETSQVKNEQPDHQTRA
ncbi:hypothetical protein IJE86_00255 [bacterium]|nr:hypothetical protein [bacterium]